MTSFRVLITDGLEEAGQAILRQAAQVDDLNGISPEDLLKAVSAYDAVIVRSRTKITAPIIQAGANLKVISRAGVGVDNIDLSAAKAAGKIVVNAPEATSAAVAELTLGLMLAMARFIPKADQAMKQGVWAKKELKGAELRGKTLGVVGMGRIGAAVAALAQAVGMRVLGYDPYLNPQQITARGALPVTGADQLYREADYLTYHVPLTPETRGVVNAESFSRMKPGVRIICTARGGVINETDLLEALNCGLVAGAALDVFAQEPPGCTDLVAHPHVIATPHIGAQTDEAQERAAIDIAGEVLAALRGEPLRWRVV